MSSEEIIISDYDPNTDPVKAAMALEEGYGVETIMWIRVNGESVPSHVAELVASGELPAEKACAIADLFETAEDFREARDLFRDHVEGGNPLYDPRFKEVIRRFVEMQ